MTTWRKVVCCFATVAGLSFGAQAYEDAYITTTDDSVVFKEVGGRKVYVFTNTTEAATVTFKQAMTLEEALLVGGGGAGGSSSDNGNAGSGGGGGGFVHTNLVVLLTSEDTLFLSVGAGGDPRAHYDAEESPYPRGGKGGSSTLAVADATVTAFGGGGGASSSANVVGEGEVGSSGGLGGVGCWDYRVMGDGLYYTSSQGGLGCYGRGGGGGAGGIVPVAANNRTPGAEGRVCLITGTAETYGSGGGGGSYDAWTKDGGVGGTHAGQGCDASSGRSINGDVGFGGGGGGGRKGAKQIGGGGGSGTVILSFSIGDTAAGAIAVDPIGDYPYGADGTSTPKPVVRCGQTVLTDEDYDLSYANNVTNTRAFNYAWVTVAGKGAHAGRLVTVPFRAVRAILCSLDATEAADGLTWTTATTFADALARCGTEWEIWLKAGRFVRTAGVTVNKAIAVRGGFAGDDDDLSRLDDVPRTVFDGNDTVDTLMSFSADGSAVVADMVAERCEFTRGKGRMVKKLPGGSFVRFRDCRFTDTRVTGAGGFSFGGSDWVSYVTFFTFSSCEFAGLSYPAGTGAVSGHAINSSYQGAFQFDDCTFKSNGVALSKATIVSGDSGVGSCISINGRNSDSQYGSIRARRCKFIGNRKDMNNYTFSAGETRTVDIGAGTRNNLFENCLFLGNEDVSQQASQKSKTGGALHYASSTTVEVSRCTFAYNLYDGVDGSAGLYLAAGAANISDSIFYGNVVGNKAVSAPDIHVAAGAYANVSNTLFAAEAKANLGAYVSAADSTHLSLEDIHYGDPKFVTGRATWLAHLTSSAGEPAIPVSPHYVMIDPETSDDVYGFDVHLKSSGGYFTNDGAWHEDCDETSDAILSDGSNLGCYAGTAEESKLLQITPELESVEVNWKDGYSQPVITFLPGGSVAYNAKATITYGVEGDMRTAVIPSVPSGTPCSFIAPTCFAPGAAFTASVRLEVGSESAEAGLDEPITIDRDYPPSWGKGGGAGVIHVSATATGDGSGSDWFNARTDLYSTLDLLEEGRSELWIAGDIVLQTIPATFKPKAAVTIRGGFAGSETDPVKRQPGVLSTIDGDSAYTPLTLENGFLVKIERVRFTHSRDSGLVKSGAGDIALLDCAFTANATNMVSVNGRGARLSGTAGITQVAVSNCVFAGNQYLSTVQNGSACYGFGLYLENLAKAEVVDTSFVTNGVDRASSWPSYNDWNARETMSGTAIYATSAPLVARRCRFVANLACTVNGRMGFAPGSGTVVLTGAGGGSVFENCLWLANAEENYTTGVTGQRDYDFLGCLRVDLSDWADTVSLTNCTMAYNIADTAYGPAGLYVQKGDVRLVNSIVWGNAVCNQCRRGADIYVASNSSLRASYSLLATNSANYVTIAAPTSDYGTVTWGPGMVYGDPLFVTDAATFLSNVHGGTPAIPRGGSGITFGKSNEVAKELCAFNVHVKGRHGYKDETTGEVVKYPKMRSPAIDAGDPNVPFPHEARPRGQRINLGFYGNTPWATMSGGGTLIFVK